MVENYHTDLMDEPINIPEVLKDGGRVILKEGGSIHDIYANTFLKKDHLGYVEVKEQTRPAPMLLWEWKRGNLFIWEKLLLTLIWDGVIC